MDAVGGESEELERRLRQEAREKELRAESGKVVASGSVYDLTSLVEKYGGVEQVKTSHKVALDNNMWNEAAYKQLDEFLKLVHFYQVNGSDVYAEFEREGGSRLVVVGSLHLSQESVDLARSTVRREKPDCLVLEQKVGDDSLQGLTIPKDLYQKRRMTKSPVELKDSDDEVERAWKFQEDRAWLMGTQGWRDIGAEAAFGKEFGAAFVEFAELGERRASEGQPAGTVCFADFDLRMINPSDEQNKEIFLVPNVEELGWLVNMPLRDLRLARAFRAALMTHKSVVGVVGGAHLAGVIKLLTQDPTIKLVKKGIELDPPVWEQYVQDNGREFEKQAQSGTSRFFERLSSADAIDAAPVGTWMSGEMLRELLAMYRKTEALLAAADADKLDEVEPVAPTSSELGEEMWSRGLMVTPSGVKDLKRWLNGERIESELSDAKVYPFENSRLDSSRKRRQGDLMPRARKRRQPKFYRAKIT